MRWVTYRTSDGRTTDGRTTDGHTAEGRERAGLVEDAMVHGLDSPLIELLDDLAGAAARALASPAEVVALSDVELCAPVPQPPSVRDFYAFEEHVKTAR